MRQGTTAALSSIDISRPYEGMTVGGSLQSHGLFTSIYNVYIDRQGPKTGLPAARPNRESKSLLGHTSSFSIINFFNLSDKIVIC